MNYAEKTVTSSLARIILEFVRVRHNRCDRKDWLCPSLRRFEVALFHDESRSGPVFCG